MELNQLKSHTLKAGTIKAGVTPQGGVKKQVEVQETTASKTTAGPSVSKEGGVVSTTTDQGFLSRTADSGLSVLTTDNSMEIALPGGQAFRWSDEGVQSLHEDGPQAKHVKNDGIDLIEFRDQEQNTVRIDPQGMTYEVVNKQRNLTHVYHPDGNHEVVAFGKWSDPETKKITDYKHHAVFNPDGELVGQLGFKDLAVDGRKLSFDLGNGIRTERQLAKPLPGQPPFEPVAASSSSPTPSQALTIFGDNPIGGNDILANVGTGSLATLVTQNSVNSPVLAEQPLLAEPVLSNPAPSATEPPVASPQLNNEGPAKSETATLDDLQALPDISKDFFASPGQDTQFHETRSGLLMREEGNTRAFKLPGGEMFRTDGQSLEVIGDGSNIKNPRIVVEGEDQLLAFSDKAGNHHTLDINTGDREVSNRQGTLTQGFKADGSTEYAVRGTYNSEAGKPQQYFFKAKFAEDGKLLSKEGFDDIKVQGESLMFTLPNGVETGRQLIEPSSQDLNVDKKLVLTGGVAQQWGGALDLAESFLNPTAAKNAPATVGIGTGNNVVDTQATNQAQQNQQPPKMRAPGQVREPLPDGSGTVSTLPNGIKFVEGKETYALDAAGNQLPVLKTVLGGAPPADGSEPPPPSYLLTVRTSDGVDYSIGNQDLNFIVQSADGKVHQMVSPDGKVMTAINDMGNQHLFELDPVKGPCGSPGCRVDPRFPDRLFVDGSPVGSYQLPHPMFGQQQVPPNSGQIPPGQSPDDQPNGMDPMGGDPLRPDEGANGPGPQSGIRPSFWDRLKSVFTGENPWDPAYQYQHNNGQYGQRPYPGNYQQYDPVSAQMAQIQRQNNAMMMMNMGVGMLQQFQMMNMMSMSFYPSPFGFGFGY